MKSLRQKITNPKKITPTNLVIASENQDPNALVDQSHDEIISVHSERPKSSSSDDSELEAAQKLQASIQSLNDIKRLPKNMQDRFLFRTSFLHSQVKKVKRETFLQQKKRRFWEFVKKWSANFSAMITMLVPWQAACQEISCRFGNITRSYFDFVQYLTILNCICGIFILYRVVIPMSDSTNLEYNNGGGNGTVVENGFFQKIISGTSLKQHPYYHYFGMDKLYDSNSTVRSKIFQNFLSGFPSARTASGSFYRAILKNRFFCRKFHSKNLKSDQISEPDQDFRTHCSFYMPDTFIEKNFQENGVDFRSYLENGTITREIKKSCYVQTNKIDNLQFPTVGETFSELGSGEGRLLEHIPMYYGFYQPTLRSLNSIEKPTVDQISFEHSKFPAEYLLSFMIVYRGFIFMILKRQKNAGK